MSSIWLIAHHFHHTTPKTQGTYRSGGIKNVRARRQGEELQNAIFSHEFSAAFDAYIGPAFD